MVAVAVAASFGSSAARAEGSANELLRAIDNGSTTLVSMVGNWGYGMTVASSIGKGDGAPLNAFCLPPTLTLTDDQYVMILRSFVKSNPTVGGEPASVVLYYSLIKTFPCR